MVCLVTMCLLAATSAFVVPAPAARASALAAASPSTSRATLRCRRAASSVLKMSEEEEAVEAVQEAVEEAQPDIAGEATKSVQSFFAPNENVRLGSSRDQDGKSNVWAVEPKMRVEGTDVESPEGNKLVVVGGIIGVMVVAMAATIAFLPSPDSL
eukprot:jgi/Undpi1/7650/HiC_scaffold_23.g10123.m1